MRKILSVFGLFAVITTGALAEDLAKPVATHPEGDNDYITFMHQFEDVDDKVIVIGKSGDFLLYMDESEELLKMYAEKPKSVKFLSIEQPAQYIKDGKCLVNIIPYNTEKELGLNLNKCTYRVFCGSSMSSGTGYAIEICGEMVED